MYEQIERPKVNSIRSVRSSFFQKKERDFKPSFEFENSRPRAPIQKKLKSAEVIQSEFDRTSINAPVIQMINAKNIWNALRNGEFTCDRWKVMSGSTANGKIYYIKTLDGEEAEVHTHVLSRMVNIRDIGASIKTGQSVHGDFAMMVIANLAETEHSGMEGVYDKDL